MMASRRAALQSIGLIGLGAAVAPFIGGHPRAPRRLTLRERWNGEPLGRIAQEYQPARAEPNTSSAIVSELQRDDVVRVRRVVRGEYVFLNNGLWLETAYGYLYASFVQPMRFHLPAQPVADLGEGRWAEVIVPYSEAFARPDPFAREAENVRGRVHYGCVFRVTKLVEGADGRMWYRVRELYQTIYLPATHLRLIPDEDLAPLSPHVPPDAKHIEVNLSEQTITAYEYGQPVYACYVSTGVKDYETPKGTHYIWDKRLSERMVADTASDDPDFYNLPGVPFVCYFTDNWVATHGTYWHNDYGRPRSHGCVNLTPQDARWFWRWTTPQGNLNELYTRVSNRYEGTRVVVR